MLGFLRGLEQGVAREGAAQRQHYGQLLSTKEDHLDRLLRIFKQNQEMNYRRSRAARSDFEADRKYKRRSLESDRNYLLRDAKVKGRTPERMVSPMVSRRQWEPFPVVPDTSTSDLAYLNPIRRRVEGGYEDQEYQGLKGYEDAEYQTENDLVRLLLRKRPLLNQLPRVNAPVRDIVHKWDAPHPLYNP